MPNLDFPQCVVMTVARNPDAMGNAQTPLRLSDYRVDVTLGANVYKADKILEVSPLEIGDPSEEYQFDITLDITEQEDRNFWMQNRDPLQCEIAFLADKDETGTWTQYHSLKGRLGDPEATGNKLRTSIVRKLEDVDLGEPKYWTHAQQQRDFPGDLGLEYKSKQTVGSEANVWPN